MTQKSHTPLPWVHDTYGTLCDRNGKQIQVSSLGASMVMAGHDVETKANAAFIIKACNSHYTLTEQRDELLAALKECQSWLIAKRDRPSLCGLGHADYAAKLIEMNTAAIAKAGA